MRELEKILEEIEQRKARAEKLIVKPPHDKLDQVANDTAEAFIEAYKECQDIIRNLSRENDPEITRCSRDTQGAEHEINLPKEEFDILRFDDSVTFRCGNEYVSLYMGEDEATRKYKHMNDGWIPVEERLPIPDKEIWVTVKRNGKVFVSTDAMTEKGNFWNYEKENILAWREKDLIPEPYRLERSEGE